jgi:hypothetical protein
MRAGRLGISEATFYSWRIIRGGYTIASFTRTLLTLNAPFDKYLNGDLDALTAPYFHNGSIQTLDDGRGGSHHGKKRNSTLPSAIRTSPIWSIS